MTINDKRGGACCNFAKGKDEGQQTTDNGQQTTDNGLQTTDYRLQTTDYRQRTTDYSRLAGCARRMVNYSLLLTTYYLLPTTYYLTLKPHAKQITYLEANPANHYHRAYGNRHYFWGAVVPLN